MPNVFAADSLKATGAGAGAPTKFVSNLQLWLKSAFSKKFKSRGNTLPHALQDDSFSCGIITLNTLEHAISNRPLWNAQRAVDERLRWFSRLAETIESRPTELPHDLNNSPTVPTPLAEALPDAGKRRTLFDLLNPIANPVPSTTPLEKLCDYDSDSTSSTKTGANTLCHLEDLPDVDYDNLLADTGSDWQSHACSASSSRLSLQDGISTNKIDTESGESSPENTAHDVSNTQGLKRSRSELSSESDYNGDSSDSEKGRRAKKYIKAGEGTSRSAMHSHKQRAQLFNGTFKVNATRYENWQAKVLNVDPHAKFDKNDCRKAWHSVCGRFKTMKEPYDFTRFKDHVEECSSKKTVGRAQTLLGMGWATKNRKFMPDVDDKELVDNEPEDDKSPTVPCPGLTEVNDPRIRRYLKRTGTMGGGGRSLAVIAKEKFQRLFSKLRKDTNRKKVVDMQMHEWTWRNDHPNFRIYATGCEKKVDSHDPKPPNPCSPCTNVLRSQAFRTAINKKLPEDEKNFKYTNHRFRNPVVGEIYARSIGVKDLIEDEVSNG